MEKIDKKDMPMEEKEMQKMMNDHMKEMMGDKKCEECKKE